MIQVTIYTHHATILAHSLLHPENHKPSGKRVLGTKHGLHFCLEYLLETFSPTVNIWRITFDMRVVKFACLHRNLYLTVVGF
jgi:hypothetical protein